MFPPPTRARDGWLTEHLQSYCCGFINLLAWIATSTGVTVILPQLISATVVYYHPSYAPQRWHLFLLYQGFNVLVMCYNVWGLRRTTWLINFGCIFPCPIVFLPCEDGADRTVKSHCRS